ncbi:hypothetical protein DIJ63_27830, partial [Burkholderia pseudomallei]
MRSDAARGRPAVVTVGGGAGAPVGARTRVGVLLGERWESVRTLAGTLAGRVVGRPHAVGERLGGLQHRLHLVAHHPPER